jgi:hypothetical protein
MTIAENLSFYLSTATTTTSVSSYAPGTILNPTNSTNTQTGALVVSGGVGVGGNLNVGGTITIGGVTYSNSNVAPQNYQTTANGAASSFTLPFTPTAATGMIVTIDGLVEYDYTVSSNLVAFNFTPANNSIIRFFSSGIIGLVSTATVTPGSVTSSSFAAGAIVANLGYTPANKNGDTLTGAFSLNGWTISTGTGISSTATLMAQAVTATYAATAFALADTSSIIVGFAGTASFATTASFVTTGTAYQYTSGTSVTAVLSPAVIWAAAAPVVLTDASSITIDMSTGFNFSLLTTSGVGSTRTLANPANIKPGQTGFIAVTQSATGNNAVTFGTNWHFSTGTVTTVTTTANAVDLIYYTAVTSSYLLTTIAKQWF